ncbi:DUF6119 family protein [Acidovorax sp. SUPP2539]|uniref:DUF6119 family protein n=1 Tax=Acidovorax sp. SUPP2539 TaxID=2920878 RepID=UPI0023DE5E42|nr:DUF6119 family protein [Acidovorax sp. SUPP2539]GKS89297.1 TIGR04141 family sporadically distributed protein [Acidovorax sp. SUPP2539]
MVKAKSIGISLRLIKPFFNTASALRHGHALRKIDIANGELYVEQNPPNQPSWFVFLEDFAGVKLDSLSSQSCGALLFVEVFLGPPFLPRLMAISFGGGHHSLEPTSLERNFGLKVALNSISSANLRSIDVATMDTTTFQKRIQSNRNADFKGFGVDVERDLLRLAAGVASDQTFARSLAGKDALLINAKMTPNDLTQKCTNSLRLYQSNKYIKDYPWVDYIAPEFDKIETEKLDEEVFSAIVSAIAGNPSDITLALPDITDPQQGFEISYFGAGLRPGKKNRFISLKIDDYIAEIVAGRPSELVDMNSIKTSHEIRFLDQGGASSSLRHRVYDCFSYEIVKNGSTYVLFGGEWFKIDQNFYNAVEASFVGLLPVVSFYPTTTRKNERQLISDLDLDKDLLNLDQVKLSPMGAPGANLEPCDFFCRSKRFIHLKDGHSSGLISHLWNQGMVSAESFVRDGEFRKELREQVKKRQVKFKKSGFETELPKGGARVDARKYQIIFGIMRFRNKRTKQLTIPFFSKVSLRPIADRLKLMGFTVEVHLIERV